VRRRCRVIAHNGINILPKISRLFSRRFLVSWCQKFSDEKNEALVQNWQFPIFRKKLLVKNVEKQLEKIDIF
jgi:hypothetical protein